MDNRVENIIKSLDKAVVTDIRTYDVRSFTPFYDYVVIASAQTSRQAISAIEYVRDDEEKNGREVKASLYDQTSTWLLLDLKDVIVHVFVGDERLKYNLDKMYEKVLG